MEHDPVDVFLGQAAMHDLHEQAINVELSKFGDRVAWGLLDDVCRDDEECLPTLRADDLRGLSEMNQETSTGENALLNRTCSHMFHVYPDYSMAGKTVKQG